MSILKKKLATEPVQANNHTEVARLFTCLHNKWARQYSTMAALEAFSVKPSYSAEIFKTLIQNTDGLFYALGNKDKPCQVLIELSPHLVENVIGAKLGTKPNSDNALTLFDLIVLQPIAETALHTLTNLGIIGGESIVCGRCIGAANIVDIDLELDTREKWVCLHFPLKTETGGADEIISMIRIYFAEPMMRLLDSAAQAMQSKATLDPSDPWANHMHDMIMDTTQVLEVVIEDVTMSIAACTRLELGHVISLPGASHTRLNVNTRSARGVQVLATSTLGAYKANKAVKLLDDIDPIFLAGIGDIEHRKSHVQFTT